MAPSPDLRARGLALNSAQASARILHSEVLKHNQAHLGIWMESCVVR